MPQLPRWIVIVAACAFVAWAFFTTERNHRDRVARGLAREADEAVVAGKASMRRFGDEARQVDRLLNPASWRTARAELTAAARRAAALAGETERSFRRAADLATQAIELTTDAERRTEWTRARESTRLRAESARAGREAYELAADESIAELQPLLDRMELLAREADRAKAEIKRLDHETSVDAGA